MGPEIIKKIEDERRERKERERAPLHLPIPEIEDDKEEVSVVSRIIEIELA